MRRFAPVASPVAPSRRSMTPRARGHHRSSRPLEEPFFDDRAIKKRKRTGRTVSVRVGRSPTSPVTTPHPHPSSIDRSSRRCARAATGSSPLAADSSPSPPIRVLDHHGRSSRGRSMESTSHEPSRGPHTMGNTPCDWMRVHEIVPRVYRRVGEQCACALTRPPSTARRVASHRAAHRRAREDVRTRKRKDWEEGHEPIRQGWVAIPGRSRREILKGWQVRHARGRGRARVHGGCHGG